MSRHQGQCLCGSIQFSFFDEPRFVAECVCQSCRVAHGATAVCWVGVAESQFLQDADQEKLKWFSSSSESERGFCTNCGTRIFFRSSKWPGEIHMARTCFESDDLVSKGVAFADEFPFWSTLTHK